MNRHLVYFSFAVPVLMALGYLVIKSSDCDPLSFAIGGIVQAFCFILFDIVHDKP